MEMPGQFIYHQEHEVHEGQTASFVGFVPFVVEIDFSVKPVKTLCGLSEIFGQKFRKYCHFIVIFRKFFGFIFFG
jgi:hypothetical protein